MSIPATQLSTWSHQGAIVGSQNTHESIRVALDQYSWPEGMVWEAYLQGSYRNSTNIRGDSDVDLVVELTATFYSNLTPQEEASLGYNPARWNWSQFRGHVLSALVSYYGEAQIDASGDKSIKVLPASGRLKGDVVVAAKYRHFNKSTWRPTAEGITFWSNNHGQIVSYPKYHYDSCVEKNAIERTLGMFKPMVRIIKNARGHLSERYPGINDIAPSHLIECLMFNVPDDEYIPGYTPTFEKCVYWLTVALDSDEWKQFKCPNGRMSLFGSTADTSKVENARILASTLVDLWAEWS